MYKKNTKESKSRHRDQLGVSSSSHKLCFAFVVCSARGRQAHTYAATPKEAPPPLLILLEMLVLREAEFAGGACKGSIQRMDPFGCGALRFFVIGDAGGRLLPLS